ncbi:acyl-CoA dehydrogenase family protein [Saccharopolyspora rosea]|uniref:acyl-CoA dehydrogenase family protein n=1 Tax=Saccharopolyspora rosea TaxID=524884 RepID=UPI0021D920A6|nr:acyl-CoA dehydrogenase family protein [Saccharopolyspora rosea]
MRFALDDDQRAMAATLGDLLDASDTGRIARQWARGEVDGWWDVWRGLAELGVTGLCVPEGSGGLGLGPVELAVCAEVLGYHALPGPLVESLAFLPTLLAGSPAEESWLSRVAAGKSLGTAIVADDVPYALDADQADAVFHCGRFGARRLDRPGLSRQESVDPARRLFAVHPSGLHEVPCAPAAVGAAFDRAVLACAAYALGLGRRMLDVSTRYVTERHQFGRPIGEFQAVKHHLADALLRLEFARPLVWGACLSADSGAACRSRDASAAKLAATEAAHTAARTALQVHGAIGYTVEHDLHLWLTKATALRTAWGTPTRHRHRVAESLRDDPDTPVGGA